MTDAPEHSWVAPGPKCLLTTAPRCCNTYLNAVPFLGWRHPRKRHYVTMPTPHPREASPPPPPDFRRLFESAPGLYLVLAPDLRIVAVSDAYLQATMTKRDEILGRGIFDVFPDNPDDVGATGVSNLRASLDRVIRNRVADTMAVQKYDIRRPASEGGGFEERYWSPVNSPVLDEEGSLTHIIHRVEDVTAFVRRQAEHDKVTADLRAHAEHMEAEVYIRAQQVQDANRRLRAANEELTTLYKRTTEEAVERLREERNFVAAVLDTSNALVVVLDAQGRIVRANHACEAMTGLTLDQIRDRLFWETLIAHEDADAVRTTLSQLRVGGPAPRHENAWIARDGSIRSIEWSCRALVDAAGALTHTVVTGLDITESRKLENQLRQAQKMEVVGRLAGGVAHDFNNLLTIILGYGELLRGRLAGDSGNREDLEQVLRAGERAAALTRQLLAFSRQQLMQPRILDLNTVVTEMDKMLRRLIGEDVELVTALAPRLGSVKADPGQVEQVILNLAVNARDAMPQGGRLTIETANVELDDEYARRHATVRPGPHVMIAVSDTGHGMDAQTQAHLFEPFFTTKERGKGTGLGLSTVYGIVKQSGGSIWVYSEPGHGATFKVYFPRVDAPADALVRDAQPSETLRGTETILLVEDSDALRSLVERVLGDAGYAVRVSRDGTEALQIIEKHAGTIHLVLTDLVMPGMSGRELAAHVARRRPGTKVLYMSGYTSEGITGLGTTGIGDAFLQKPFTSAALAAKVREVLDTPGERP